MVFFDGQGDFDGCVDAGAVVEGYDLRYGWTGEGYDFGYGWMGEGAVVEGYDLRYGWTGEGGVRRSVRALWRYGVRGGGTRG